MSQSAMTFVLPLALMWIMFCVGLTITVQDFRRVVVTPGVVLVGLTLQLLGLPLLALLIIKLLALPGAIAIGLWLLALSPGGATSNAISQMCGGDAALSITMTAIGSLLIPLSMPLMLPLMLDDASLVLPFKATVLQLFVVTVIPVLLGMLVKHRASPAWLNRWLARLQQSSFIALLITVLVIVLANQQVMAHLWSIAAFAAMVLCFSGMLIGYLVSKIWADRESLKVTFAIEVGIQNAGTAIFVAAVLLQRPDLALTPLVYGILMNIPAIALILLSRRRQESYV